MEFRRKINRATTDEIKAGRITTYEVEEMKEYSRNKHVHRGPEIKAEMKKRRTSVANRWKCKKKKKEKEKEEREIK